MGTSAYKEIKSIFDPFSDFCYKPFGNPKTYKMLELYVEDIYKDIQNDYCKKDNYFSMSTKLMGIDESEFKKLLMETIFINIYCYLTLIKQIIENKGMRREWYILNMKIDDKQTIDRFRKRLQRSRIMPHNMRSFEAIHDYQCYIPHLLQVFKDAIFVHREGTDIYDISPYYADVFTALMYENNELLSDNSYVENRNLIKAYKLWAFTTTTVHQVSEIYDVIINPRFNVHGDKICQLVLLEQMFGFLSLCKLIEKEHSQKTYIEIAYQISNLSHLGYSGLHTKIINSVDENNVGAYGTMIDQYIYPLCCKVIGVFINSIVLDMAGLTIDKNIEFINKLYNNCKRTIASSLVATDIYKYDLHESIQRKIKYHNASLRKDLSVVLMKAYTYSYVGSNKEKDIQQCLYATRDETGFRYDFNNHEKSILDCSIIDLLAGVVNNNPFKDYYDERCLKETSKIRKFILHEFI